MLLHTHPGGGLAPSAADRAAIGAFDFVNAPDGITIETSQIAARLGGKNGRVGYGVNVFTFDEAGRTFNSKIHLRVFKMNSLEENEMMWTTEIEHYLLMVSDPKAELTIENAVIVDRRHPSFVCIEEDSVYFEVKRRMLEAGVEMVRLNDVRYLFEPPA